MILTYLNKKPLIEELDSKIKADYTEYIAEHKEFVHKSYEWLKDNCSEMFENIDAADFEEQIAEHDASKFSTEEFEPYANKWFGDGEKTPEYEAAWEHHWQSNPHHPEYWAGEDMPIKYLLEMICDWFSFGLKKDNPKEIIEFYNTKAKDDPEKNLSAATKKQIEKYLSMIDEVC